MIHDVLIHTQQALNEGQRQTLLKSLGDQLGISLGVHHSDKPHLVFVPTDPQKAPPHTVLQAVREQGYQAVLVDL
jgi:hypothetical protein